MITNIPIYLIAHLVQGETLKGKITNHELLCSVLLGVLLRSVTIYWDPRQAGHEGSAYNMLLLAQPPDVALRGL